MWRYKRHWDAACTVFRIGSRTIARLAWFYFERQARRILKIIKQRVYLAHETSLSARSAVVSGLTDIEMSIRLPFSSMPK